MWSCALCTEISSLSRYWSAFEGAQLIYDKGLEMGGGWGAASMIYTARARCVQMWRNWSHITFLSFTRCPQPHSLVAVTISTLLLPFKCFVWCGTSLSVWELIFESTNNPWVSTESSVLRILHKRFAHGKCATIWIGCAVLSQWAALVMKKARWWRWNLIIKGALLSLSFKFYAHIISRIHGWITSLPQKMDL